MNGPDAHDRRAFVLWMSCSESSRSTASQDGSSSRSTASQDGSSSRSTLAGRRVAGLSIALRLALSAQAAGATAIHLAPSAAGCRGLLVDSRLRIPVIDGDPPGVPGVRIEPGAAATPLVVATECDVVVHRSWIRDLVADASKRNDFGATGHIEPEPSENTGRSPEHDHDAPSAPRALSILETPSRREAFGFDPIVVRDRASAREATTALLRALRKTQDGWVSTHLNRHISLAITRGLATTDVRPNTVTLLTLSIGIAAAIAVSGGTYWPQVLGGVLFQWQSILDGCDGELSRLTYRTSRAGEWLDTIADDLTNYGFFAGASIGLARSAASPVVPGPPPSAYLLAGAIVVGCGVAVSAIQYRYLVSIGSGDLLRYPLGLGPNQAGGAGVGARTPSLPRSPVGRIADGVAVLFKRDSFVLMAMIASILGRLDVLLTVFAGGAVAILVATLRAEVRRKAAP